MGKRVIPSSSADAGSEAILPLTDFRGDPWETGEKNAVAFRGGVWSSPVPAAFAKKARTDGLAAPRAEAPASPEPTAADTAADQPSQD